MCLSGLSNSAMGNARDGPRVHLCPDRQTELLGIRRRTQCLPKEEQVRFQPHPLPQLYRHPYKTTTRRTHKGEDNQEEDTRHQGGGCSDLRECLQWTRRETRRKKKWHPLPERCCGGGAVLQGVTLSSTHAEVTAAARLGTTYVRKGRDAVNGVT